MANHNSTASGAASPSGSAGFPAGDGGLAAMTEMSRNNAEAMLQAAKPLGRVAETLARETSDYMRKSFDDGVAILRTLADARTPADLALIQFQLARAALDNAAAFSEQIGAAVRSLSTEAAPVVDPGSDGAGKPSM